MTLCVWTYHKVAFWRESCIYNCNFSVNKNILNAFRNCRCQKSKYGRYNLLFFPFMMLPNLKLETFGFLFNLQNSKGEARVVNYACFYLPAFSSSFNIWACGSSFKDKESTAPNPPVMPNKGFSPWSRKCPAVRTHRSPVEDLVLYREQRTKLVLGGCQRPEAEQVFGSMQFHRMYRFIWPSQSGSSSSSEGSFTASSNPCQPPTVTLYNCVVL